MIMRLLVRPQSVSGNQIMAECCERPSLETESAKSGRYKGAATIMKVYCANCNKDVMSFRYRG